MTKGHIIHCLIPSILPQITGQEIGRVKKEVEEEENNKNDGEEEVKEERDRDVDGNGANDENRFIPVRADDLLRALESVTAAVFRCSHVKVFLVSSDVIGTLRGDLLFLSDAHASPSSSSSSSSSVKGSSSTANMVSKGVLFVITVMCFDSI